MHTQKDCSHRTSFICCFGIIEIDITSGLKAYRVECLLHVLGLMEILAADRD